MRFSIRGCAMTERTRDEAAGEDLAAIAAGAPVRQARLPRGPAHALPKGGQLRRQARWVHLRAFMENKLAVVGVAFVVLMVLFCFAGPLFWHTNQVTVNMFDLNRAPSGKHPLGTDDLGYDVLGRLMSGGRASLEVGVAVAVIATGLGVISGYIGGITDAIMMRVVDIVLAIPVIYLFIDLSATFRPTILLLILVLA